jgi:20S proteasome subunit beta 1
VSPVVAVGAKIVMQKIVVWTTVRRRVRRLGRCRCRWVDVAVVVAILMMTCGVRTVTVADGAGWEADHMARQHFVSISATPAIFEDEPVDLGTTLVAIKFRTGVVVGADSRTSISSYVSHRHATKVTPLAPHVVVARSGSAADTQHLAEQARLDMLRRSYRYGMPLTVVSPSTVAHWLKSVVYSFNAEENGGKSVSLIVAGYDHATHKPQIYTIAPSGALLEESLYAMAGSGSTLIAGFLDEAMMPETKQRRTSSSSALLLDEAEAVELCRKAISLAVQRDASSGGEARIYVCDATGTRDVTFGAEEETQHDEDDSTTAWEPTELAGFAPPTT